MDNLPKNDYYLERQNGSFLVHFPNFHKLTQTEIRERFEEYGKVVTVDMRGQVSGLCFVSYENEQGAIRCLDGFRHNKQIRILKHKFQNKTQDETKSKQMQQADAAGSVISNNGKAKSKALMAKNGGPEDDQRDKKSNSECDKEKSHLKTKGHLDAQGSVKNYPKIALGNSKSISKSEKKLVEPKVEQHSPGSAKSVSKLKNKMTDNKLKTLVAGGLPNFKAKKKGLDPKMETELPTLMSIDLQSTIKNNMEKEQCFVSYTDFKGNSIADDNTTLNDFDSLPDQQSRRQDLRSERMRSVVSPTSSSIKSVKSVATQYKTEGNTCLAQEIIVANIDGAFGVHYILHLFDKFNPIASSMMKTTSRSKIRYCHVYFAHWKEALAIQQEFDDYSLEGKKLVVLTSQNLIREALAS